MNNYLAILTAIILLLVLRMGDVFDSEKPNWIRIIVLGILLFTGVGLSFYLFVSEFFGR